MLIDFSFKQIQKVCHFSLYNTIKMGIPLNRAGWGKTTGEMFREDPSGDPSLPAAFPPPHRDLVPAERKGPPQPLSVAEGTGGLAGRWHRWHRWHSSPGVVQPIRDHHLSSQQLLSGQALSAQKHPSSYRATDTPCCRAEAARKAALAGEEVCAIVSH